MDIKILKVLLLLIPLCLNAASNTITNSNYTFKKIGIEQGLSQSSIRSIVQDYRGYMWFGTATGLNRYDGYEFLVYQNDFSDSLSISDNDLTSIFEDNNGFLWIGTKDGVLNKFDPQTENFEHFDIASSSEWYSLESEDFYDYPLTFSRYQKSSITSITQDKNGNLWIGTWGKGIVRFNPETGDKKYFYHFRNRRNGLSSNKIVKLLIDSDNNLWIGTFGGGLNRIRFNSENIDEIFIEKFNKGSKFIYGSVITSILEDSKNNILVGSYNEGIYSIPRTDKNKNENELKESLIKNEKNNKIDTAIFNVMSIIEDNNSTLWIGTYGNGLYAYSPNLKAYTRFQAEPNNPNTISENEIQSLYIDKSGILWIGTQLSSGINKLEMGERKFYEIPTLTEKNKSLNDNIVWAIYEDKEENIWIGTHRGGINIWDRNSNKFSYFHLGDSESERHIKCFEEDSYGNLWIGTYSGGLFHYNFEDKKLRKFKRSKGNSSSISSNHIQSMLVEGDSTLWIGTYSGLNKLNLISFYKTGKAQFTKYVYNPTDLTSLSDDRVYILYKDMMDYLWVGTNGGGLNRFNRSINTFTRYNSEKKNKKTLSDNRILTIHENKVGDLIVGTFGGGLNLYNRSENNFIRINEKISLNCSDIYGILSDISGYWISTNNGIFKLDEELSTFTRFDLSDGLQSLEFSGGAYLKGKDGTFYFGGVNGLNYFSPGQIRLNEFIPPIVISKIKVFDKPIKGEPSKLEFGIDENYFSFEFASLDFKNSNKNKYKFIMDGLDSKWSYTDAENRRVFYTNLAPGEYTFRVMGTNDDGIWSPKEARVDITILAPFWMRWWFISALILFVGGLISFYINQRIKYLVALDRLKTNIAADLHDNVGAGLTEISILSELATNQIDKPVTATKHINQISELSRKLVESMSDIVWVVNPTRDSLYDLIVRLKDMYGELLSDLGIKLHTSDLEKLNTIKLPMDYRQNLYLMLKESIINCIKHSKCKNINLRIIVFRNKLFIKLIDDGIGFNVEQSAKGNGIINIKDRGQKIGGKISIESAPSKGTKIEFEGKIK